MLLLAAFPVCAVGASAADVPSRDALRVSGAPSPRGSGTSLGSAKMLESPATQSAPGNQTDNAEASEPAEDPHQSEILWTQGNWTVFGDEEDCSLDLSFAKEGEPESFSSLDITMHFGDTSARIAFANARFTEIQADKEYPVSMVFIKEGVADTRWGEQSFTGFEDFQANALFADLSWDELHRDMIEATGLAIFLNGELLDQYPLEGAGAAVSQLEQCLLSNGALGVSDARSAALTV